MGHNSSQVSNALVQVHNHEQLLYELLGIILRVKCMVQQLNINKNYIPYKFIQDFFKWFKWIWLLFLNFLNNICLIIYKLSQIYVKTCI
jgi:hypothetical protein